MRSWFPRRATRAVAAGFLALLLASPADADRWEFDRDHTEIRFSWNHMGLARQSAEFKDFFGALEFSPTEPENGRIEVTIIAASIDSGVSKLDDVLRSSDYFDSARHRHITFKSLSVRAIGPRTGAIQGELTILGRTHPVTLAATWNFSGVHPMAQINPNYAGRWASGFSASTTIKRSAWGLDRATPLVSDEIAIQIEAEFLRIGDE